VSVPALEVRDVWLSFGETTVLEAVNLDLPAGEFLGIIGPNGAGKTMFLKVLLGLATPDRGTVRVLGKSPVGARGHVGYVAQHAQFDLGFPIRVLDVVLQGRLARRKLLRPFAAADRDRAIAALERVRMGDFGDRQIGKLSGGQLQRVLIARALAVDAKLLLLDEPAANLDTNIANELHELLASLTPEITVVLVSHDVGVISRHVGSIACLNRRLHFHGSREVTREMVEETYGCPVDFIVHRHTHLVLSDHHEDESP
jgi:zinc transport system ATP-binding protein